MVIANLSFSCSIRKASKNPVTANLEEQYTVRYGNPISPEIDEITTICPSFFLKWSMAYLVQYRYPKKLVYITV